MFFVSLLIELSIDYLVICLCPKFDVSVSFGGKAFIM